MKLARLSSILLLPLALCAVVPQSDINVTILIKLLHDLTNLFTDSSNTRAIRVRKLTSCQERFSCFLSRSRKINQQGHSRTNRNIRNGRWPIKSFGTLGHDVLY